ncbi:Lysophospholipase L1 [Aliiroseovarius halocynthiae]|uniref:SGNH/GDSL hydrolase family protein n=1 Tax=Aliiroseovarius halocynthiae TaxID=985055 RepID=A0A545SP85_9RHOB|nr:SGNH/GDSL hydrolase family protein [Aliiroseovarius halocynthiae]TQV66789.1 SGNH/GDSL hydrolase family protein [Aliiroseovarius halocynthiae]SMR82380.1 Lysophospholipase L1 [Aliiroseovarius halocynthiae]
MIRTLALILTLFAGSHAAMAGERDARILVIGDSLMAWHKMTGRSIGHMLGRYLHEPVVNRAIGGARIIYNLPISGSMGMKISRQFRDGDWDWVVLNGGGNDLWFGCGCNRCNRKINLMISINGRYGPVPDLINRIRATGAKVIVIGYLRSPGVGSPIENCRDDGDAYEARLQHMAQQMKGVYFMSNKDLVPHGDRSYHGIDMIHPSFKGSAMIAKRVALLIKKLDRKR